MGNDGDKKGTQEETGTEPQGASREATGGAAQAASDDGQAAAAAAQAEADAAVAAAAAAEAAAAAAEAARLKAEAARLKAEAAKKATTPPPAVTETPDLSVDAQKTKGGSSGDPAIPSDIPRAPRASSARSAVGGEKGIVEIEPNAEGLFGTDVIDEQAGRDFVPEKAFMSTRQMSAIISLVVAVGLIIAGTIFLVTDSNANARMKWFLSGTACNMDPKTMEPYIPQPPDPPGNLNCLRLHVEQQKRFIEAKWRQEDYRSRHIYGMVTLTYFPQDANVHVWQTKYVQDGKAWARNEAGPGEMVCDDVYVRTDPDKVLGAALKKKGLCERPLKNNTEDLKENQFIEQLPLKNLPIFETDKCTEQLPSWDPQAGLCKEGGKEYRKGNLVNAYEYQYRVVIAREGYEPREFLWTRRDWTRAPGAYIMNWPGADLVPKPETFRSNFVQAHCEIFCYQQIHDVSFANIPEDNLQMIFKRNGFKSDEDFKRAEGALTRGEYKMWWLAREEAIAQLGTRIDAINKSIANRADRLKCKAGDAHDCAKVVCEYKAGIVCGDVAAEALLAPLTPAEAPAPPK